MKRGVIEAGVLSIFVFSLFSALVSAQGSALNMTGTWNGNWTSLDNPPHHGTYDAFLIQAGDAINGTIMIHDTPEGIISSMVSGNLSGDKIKFGNIGGSVSFSGTASLSSATGTYGFSESDFSDSGNWKMTRCIEEWQCSQWPPCDNGTQTRECDDVKVCNANQSTRTESRSCQMEVTSVSAPAPVQTKQKPTALIFLIILTSLALLAALSFLGMRVLTENSLKSEILQMSRSIDSHDLEDARKRYEKIGKLFKNMPEKSRRAYNPRVTELYMKFQKNV